MPDPVLAALGFGLLTAILVAVLLDREG